MLIVSQSADRCSSVRPQEIYTGQVSPARRILLYSIIRVVLVAVPFIILMILNVPWWASAIIAVVIAGCLSYLFLSKQRDEVAQTVSGWRRNGTSRDDDNDLENEALDRREEQSH